VTTGSDVVVRRLVLLLSTPRIAPGLFTRDAWTALAGAAHVLARDEDETQLNVIQQSGIAATHLGDQDPSVLARILVDRTDDGEVVWIGSADADPGLTDALAAEISSRQDPPEIEMLVGSYDVPGARLLDLVAVMDRLRSPGGCPWDAEQTHETLTSYAIEETHELVEAIESGDREHMKEELGDLLLQVAFHARIAQEDPESPFGIDEVAGGIVEKLVRRHPHVFADGDAETAPEVAASWEQIKAAEKPHRTSVLDGIPKGLPALASAHKAAGRLSTAGRYGVALSAAADDDLGSRLLALVLEARDQGLDPEAALRATVRALDSEL
jgi:XTP/dITP diphosphohydrolase